MVRAGLDRRGLINDPHAASMLSGPFRFAHRIVPKGRTTSSAAWLAARTLAVDAAVAAAFDAGIEQLVILGAGYDSRAWRLAPAGVAVFEIDHPATQLVKQARARRAPARRTSPSTYRPPACTVPCWPRGWTLSGRWWRPSRG